MAVASRQERFTRLDASKAQSIFDSTYVWAKKSWMDVPQVTYGGDSRRLDTWIQDFIDKEPHLSGVNTSVTAINKNRGWSMVGGRNLVRQTASIFYNAHKGKGWRHYIGLQSKAYYTCRQGAITELGRTISDQGPLAAIWHGDSTKFTINNYSELEYYPNFGKKQIWQEMDYARFVDTPDQREETLELGMPAALRCLSLAQMMMAVFEHDKESLGAAPPSGFITVTGIGIEQFEQAMAARKARMDASDQLYYRDIVVLANETEDVELKMLALSNLPQNFTLEAWVQILMQGYALCYGYDVNEFYSIRSGAALGIAQQSLTQAEKASAKGEMDMVLAWQAQMRRHLPASVDFVWDERSDAGDKLRAEGEKLFIENAVAAYTAMAPEEEAEEVERMFRRLRANDLEDVEEDEQENEQVEEGGEPGELAAQNKALAMQPPPPKMKPLFTRDMALRYLADRGVITRDYLGIDESENIDTGIVRELRDHARDNLEVRRYAEVFPDEPIICKRHNGKEHVLYKSASDLVKRQWY